MDLLSESMTLTRVRCARILVSPNGTRNFFLEFCSSENGTDTLSQKNPQKTRGQELGQIPAKIASFQ